MKNKFFEYLDYYLINELLYECFADEKVSYITIKQNNKHDTWIAKIELVSPEGKIESSQLFLNEYEVWGTNQFAEKVGIVLRKYLINKFGDEYKQKLIDYRVDLLYKKNGIDLRSEMLKTASNK